jgi:hypothetical protein
MNYPLRFEILSIAMPEQCAFAAKRRRMREIRDHAVTGEPLPAAGVQTPPTRP